jgi:hypothetical protein
MPNRVCMCKLDLSSASDLNRLRAPRMPASFDLPATVPSGFKEIVSLETVRLASSSRPTGRLGEAREDG